MASHHHHHLQSTTCCSSACPPSNHCCNPSPPPPPPQSQPLQSTDQLLQSLASLLQQQQPQQNQPISSDQTHFKRNCQNQSFRQRKPHFHRREEPQLDLEFVLSSLLTRIEALESSLHYFSSNKSHPSRTLRDAAARVIQTQFRAFLVRRSKALSQLKELALIKSRFSALKLSISNKTHVDLGAISRKAMDFLVTLDSIQGGDPMIRDGKRSISTDLLQFLDYLDEIAAKGHKVYYRAAKNVRIVPNSSKSRVSGSTLGGIVQKRREVVERLRNQNIHGCHRNVRNDDEDLVELEGFHQIIDEIENPKICISRNEQGVLVKRQGNQPRVKKTVSFAENGNVYRVFSNEIPNEQQNSSGEGTLTDESISSDDQGDNNVEKETENEEARMENEEYRTQINEEDEDEDEDEDGGYDLSFCAPLPMKMESRVYSNKSKGVRIAS